MQSKGRDFLFAQMIAEAVKDLQKKFKRAIIYIEIKKLFRSKTIGIISFFETKIKSNTFSIGQRISWFLDKMNANKDGTRSKVKSGPKI